MGRGTRITQKEIIYANCTETQNNIGNVKASTKDDYYHILFKPRSCSSLVHVLFVTWEAQCSVNESPCDG